MAKLTAADAAADDDFGISVAIDGNTVVVGPSTRAPVPGSVYIFRTTDGGATAAQVAKLTASDAAAMDFFGYSVAIDGGTIVVGPTRPAYCQQRGSRPTSSSRPTAAPRTPRWPS